MQHSTVEFEVEEFEFKGRSYYGTIIVSGWARSNSWGESPFIQTFMDIEVSDICADVIFELDVELNETQITDPHLLDILATAMFEENQEEIEELLLSASEDLGGYDD